MIVQKQLMRLNQRELNEFVEAVRIARSGVSTPRSGLRALHTLERALERARVRRIAAIFKAA